MKYVVKKGDTLSTIAQEQYGDANRWREILEANKDQIENPNVIRPGWELDIPGAGEAETEAEAEKEFKPGRPGAWDKKISGSEAE